MEWNGLYGRVRGQFGINAHVSVVPALKSNRHHDALARFSAPAPPVRRLYRQRPREPGRAERIARNARHFGVPDLRIVSRITHERNVEAIHRAGADFALSYTSLGVAAVTARLDERELTVIGGGLDLTTRTMTDNDRRKLTEIAQDLEVPELETDIAHIEELSQLLTAFIVDILIYYC